MKPPISSQSIGAPFQEYFEPKQGRWRGEYRFSITPWGALTTSPVGMADRCMVVSLALLCKLFGNLRIETEVDTSKLERGEVLHATRISKWGVTLFRSVERFLMEDDGRKLTVRGDQRYFPSMGKARDYGESFGEIGEDGSRALYSFEWLGTRLRQESIPEGARLGFTQDTDWSHGEFVLTHLSPLPKDAN